MTTPPALGPMPTPPRATDARTASQGDMPYVPMRREPFVPPRLPQFSPPPMASLCRPAYLSPPVASDASKPAT